ncbi:TnsA-like heteromeric transposase endonuclease subunit [Rhodococcus sp. NPDC059968]|uniref:TnsA-like heteromeric transposase endonuclease subunit n=1 Tax=Rhodococcus sp. NPDC059968 TaxID=3347017 RepID=UPI0036704CF4
MIYESRLELARLLLADFDRVRRILAQPFLLEADVAGARRRHVPDYLLLSDDGPVVVDVKPARLLAKPEVALTFAWTRLVVESRGWRFQIASEPAEPGLSNVRFLTVSGFVGWPACLPGTASVGAGVHSTGGQVHLVGDLEELS